MSEHLQNLAAIGDALAGFASVAALAAAVIAAVVAWRTLGVERARDAHAREREVSEQAALVSSWCASRDDRRRATGGGMRGLVVRNASTSPVYEVRVHSTWAPSAKDPAQKVAPCKIAVLPPGEVIVEDPDYYPWSFPSEDRPRPLPV
ncbi:hypothetical protein ACEK07_41830, partial [Alcanivoracaceae bacterium MT1]